MSLTAAEVAEIMRLVEQSTFDELTLEMDGVKLSLRRGAAVQMNGGPLPTGVGLGEVSGGVGASYADGSGSATGSRGGVAAGTSGAGRQAGAASGAVAGAAGYPALTPSAARASAANSISSGTAATQANAASGATSPAIPPLRADQHDVLSPLLGTFYRSPKPGAPPFVEVGAKVEADTVIAIIEVMKLMNTVRAGVSGTVTDIFITDGSLVEFEQPLVRVSKAG